MSEECKMEGHSGDPATESNAHNQATVTRGEPDRHKKTKKRPTKHPEDDEEEAEEEFASGEEDDDDEEEDEEEIGGDPNDGYLVSHWSIT